MDLGVLRELSLLSIAVRITVSMVIGGILGAERGFRNRPAGFMTYILVSVGATIIMLTNQYIVLLWPDADPSRLAAQVVSGIGFLGAGTILVTRNDEVRGLTTAAGLWTAAGLGLAIGIGFYEVAVLGFAAWLFAVLVLKKLDVYIKQHARSMDIYLEYDPAFSLRELAEFADRYGFELYDLHRGRAKTLTEDKGTLSFSLALQGKLNHQAILNEIYALDGVEYIREIF